MQDDADAQFYLAERLEQGNGIAKNPDEAAGWFYKATQLGNSGLLYREQDQWDNETLMAFQTLLRNAGYYTGTIDGETGPGTKAAIRELCDCIFGG